mgnify:CR=1 FL=1
MIRTRNKTSNILNQDNLEKFVQDIYTNNKKINKRVKVCSNLHVYQQKQLYILKKRHNKTSNALFLKKLEFDSLDILYKVVQSHVNRILNTFGRFLLHIFRPTCNYKYYPHLCNKTYRRLNKFKNIPRAIILINRASINRFLR